MNGQRITALEMPTLPVRTILKNLPEKIMRMSSEKIVTHYTRLFSLLASWFSQVEFAWKGGDCALMPDCSLSFDGLHSVSETHGN